jgi:hypothetical protein
MMCDVQHDAKTLFWLYLKINHKMLLIKRHTQ